MSDGVRVGFGTLLALDVLGRTRAIAIDQINVRPSGDGLNGSLSFESTGDDPHKLPPLDIGTALRVHVGGANHQVRVSSIKVMVNSASLKGVIGIRPETDADLQGDLPLEGDE